MADIFDYIPFGLGDDPLGRFFVIFSAVTGLIYICKPEFAFDGNRDPRSWTIFSSGPNATTIPFWLPGVLLGLIAALYF